MAARRVIKEQIQHRFCIKEQCGNKKYDAVHKTKVISVKME